MATEWQRLGSARESIGHGTGLHRSSDWEPLDAQVCRVAALTPLGVARALPYASIELEPAAALDNGGYLTGGTVI